jgi:hypothetical protein
VLCASYALIGLQFQPGHHGPPTGIHAIPSNGGGDIERPRRESLTLETGLFYSAARSRLIEGFRKPAEWLEIFETEDPGPLDAYYRATAQTPDTSQIHPD